MQNFLTPTIAFAVVAFFLGELGDGLNIFQGIYLVGIGWNESAIGIALSLMGFTSLVVQTYAGDIIDKTTIDRRVMMTVAAFFTAASAMAIMFVREGNTDHILMYITKVIEGIASSFINPCLAALTLASFGPDRFDSVMASNALWGHVGSAVSAVLAGSAAYIFYPNIKCCFYVIGCSAFLAIVFVHFLPEGDPLMGRGFHAGKATNDTNQDQSNGTITIAQSSNNRSDNLIAASYWSVFSERRTLVLCMTGLFFHFANANVLLVLGELMSIDDNNDDDNDNDDGAINRAAIPLIAGAILLAQATMSAATLIGDFYTKRGVGRKILFLTGLITLPIRCALIIYWKDAGVGYLLSTQIFDGLGGGFFALIHPYLVADITFGTGRFNIIMGMTSSCFGLGATLSNLLGQMMVEKLGHVASLTGSFVISFIPIALFSILMPETLNTRGQSKISDKPTQCKTDYAVMA